MRSHLVSSRLAPLLAAILLARWALADSLLLDERVELGPTPQTRAEVYTLAPDGPDARVGILVTADLRRGSGSVTLRTPDGADGIELTFGPGSGRFARVLGPFVGGAPAEVDVKVDLAVGTFRIVGMRVPSPEGFIPVGALGGVILAMGLAVAAAASLRGRKRVGWIALGAAVWVAGMCLHWVWTSRVDPMLTPWLAARLGAHLAPGARAAYGAVVATVFQLGAMAAALPLLPVASEQRIRAGALAAGFTGAALIVAGANMVADTAFAVSGSAGSHQKVVELALDLLATRFYLVAGTLEHVAAGAVLFVCVVLLHRRVTGTGRAGAALTAAMLYLVQALLRELPSATAGAPPRSAWWAVVPLACALLPVAVLAYKRMAGEFPPSARV